MFKHITTQLQLLQEKPPLKSWWLLLLLCLLFIPHLYHSYYFMLGNQPHDLHLRILGSRLMEAGKNPYTYYWQKGDSIFWYDPNQSIYSSVNGVTSTPFFLWLQLQFAQLNYCSIKTIWWVVEEFFMLATIVLAAFIPTNKLRQLLLLLFAAIFFLYSRNWWLHILNGQLYVVYAFVFMLSIFLLVKLKRNISFIFYPVFCLVRPFFVLSILPFFSLQKKQLVQVIIGGCIAVVLLLASNTKNNWFNYANAMKVYATESTGGYDSVLRNKEARLGNFASEDCLIKEKKGDFLHAGCLYSVQSYLSKMGIQCNNTNAFSLALLLIVALILWLEYQQKIAISIEQKIVLSILLYMLAELLAPASRNAYNMIQWLPIVTVLIAYGSRFMIGLLLLGLCLNHSTPFDLKYVKELGECLMFIAAGLFVIHPNLIYKYKN